MKSSAPLKRIVLARRIAVLFLAGAMIVPGITHTANAAIYYWDTNGTTAGFGSASGTWGTDAFWSTSTAGTTATANTTILNTNATTDAINLGTATLGLGAGMINVGTVASGNITFGSASGAITLSGGTITLSSAANTISVFNATDTINSELAGAGSITKIGNGTLVLTGNNSYAGATTLTRGTIVLDKSSGSGSIADTSILSVGANSDGGTFILKGSTTGITTETIGGISPGNNVSMLKIVIDPNGGTGTTLALGSTWTSGTNTSILFDYSSASAGARQVTTATATGTSNGIYGRALVKDINGVVGFAARDAGTGVITRFVDAAAAQLASNSNSGTTNFTTLGTPDTFDWTGVVGNRAVNSLTIDTTNNTAPVNINLGATTNTLTITSLGLLFKGSTNATVTGGQIGTSGETIIHQTGTGTLTIDSLINSVNSAFPLQKDGSGTLIIGGANTFTGAIAVNEGILRLGAAGNATASPIGAGTALPVRVGPGGTFDLGGYTITTTTVRGITLSGMGVNAAGTLINSGGDASFPGQLLLRSSASIIANNGSISLPFTGAIGESGSTTTGVPTTLTLGGTATGSSIAGNMNTGIDGGVTKIGTGSWILSGTNTYAGPTNVNAGKLSISTTGSLAATSGIFIGAGNFNYNSSTSLARPISFTATGGTLSGNGTINTAVSIPSGNTVAPGNSPGILTFNAGLTLAAGANIQWELFSDSTIGAGTNFDQIMISGGVLNLADGVNFVPTFNGLSYTGPTDNAFWDTTQTWAGVFTLTGAATNVGASVLTIDNSAWAGFGSFATQLNGSNIDLVWTATAIPEPGTLVIGGLTMLGFAAHGLRRRRRQA